MPPRTSMRPLPANSTDRLPVMAEMPPARISDPASLWNIVPPPPEVRLKSPLIVLVPATLMMGAEATLPPPAPPLLLTEKSILEEIVRLPPLPSSLSVRPYIAIATVFGPTPSAWLCLMTITLGVLLRSVVVSNTTLPLKVLLPVSVSSPPPALVRLPVPPIVPAKANDAPPTPTVSGPPPLSTFPLPVMESRVWA